MQTRPTPTTRRPPTTMPKERSQHDAELVDELAGLLDEVDAVLEENAWVTRYVQKGGQ